VLVLTKTSIVAEKIVWGVTNQEAFAEMPEYPKTPTHITAPMSSKDALAELPSYPNTPAALEAAMQEEISADASEITDCDAMEVDIEVFVTEPKAKIEMAPLQLSATLPTPDLASPVKSALRSPQKFETKTPKKAVTWGDEDEEDLFMYNGPLQGLTFFVDITSNGRPHNYVFASLLEDLGAKVAKEWVNNGISHVLFKDGSLETLEKVVASKGAIKCVNVGWVLDSESNRKRMDEADYLVDLSVAIPKSPAPKTSFNFFTPARTPSKYALPPSTGCRSIPSTPTSSEFDRSINVDDDKENSELGLFFTDMMGPKSHVPRTCPPKKSSVLMGRSPMKTPSKPSFLTNEPLKPFSTTKKRSLEFSFPGISSAPPKKLRLF
jgi:hypothetical protein